MPTREQARVLRRLEAATADRWAAELRWRALITEAHDEARLTYRAIAPAAGLASHARVLALHILPNCMSPIIVKASMDMGLAILAAASLGFIGLGARPPAPEWGAMISVARTYMPAFWWYAFFPGLFIYLTVLGFNLFGDGLRDILDPKSNQG